VLANRAAQVKRNRLDGGVRGFRPQAMSKKDENPPGEAPPRPPVRPQTSREDKLAAALRANLRRRKAAARPPRP